MLRKIIKYCEGSSSYYFTKKNRSHLWWGGNCYQFSFLYFLVDSKNSLVSSTHRAHLLSIENPVEASLLWNTSRSLFCLTKSRTTVLFFCALWKAMVICHCSDSGSGTVFPFPHLDISCCHAVNSFLALFEGTMEILLHSDN